MNPSCARCSHDLPEGTPYLVVTYHGPEPEDGRSKVYCSLECVNWTYAEVVPAEKGQANCHPDADSKTEADATTTEGYGEADQDAYCVQQCPDEHHPACARRQQDAETEAS